MIDFDPSRLTQEERGKIEKRARKNVGSDVVLILTAGFAFCMVVLFWYGDVTFLPMAAYLEVRPTLVWIIQAFTISVVVASIYGWQTSRRVMLARKKMVIVHQFDEAQKRTEIDAKMKSLKG
ncbi:MAG: hypothetical protein AAGB04_29290 [Pseudomonadota bacterium]